MRVAHSCPHCGKKYTARDMKKHPILHRWERAVRWIRMNKRIWENGHPVRGGWRDDHPISSSYRAIAMGLKNAGIYSQHTGLWDMPIRKLVDEARRETK